MNVHRHEVKHLVLPGHIQSQQDFICGESITHFLERNEWKFKIPTICVLNGVPVLRADWNTTIILETDVISFISKPHGGSSGGGSGKVTQVIGLVAIIALTAIAPWAAGAVAGALGITSTAVIGLIQAGIVIGGSLLLSSFLKPKAGGQNSNDLGNTEQVYSLSASGNIAKPLQAINVQYGRLKILPDYVSSPYSEYIGDDQYLNLLLCQGLGKYEIEQITIDDTTLWDSVNGLSTSFSDVAIEFYNPGEDVTLFPSNVTQASEVNGQTIPDNPSYLGGYIANASGTISESIAVDLAFPSGLFSVDSSSGNIGAASVTITAEYRSVDEAGSPTSVYGTLFSKTYTMATRNPKRITEKVSVLPGRYEVRVKRSDATSTNSNISNGAVWLGLRSFLQGPSSYPNVSTVAIRIKATAQLSNSSAKQFGLIQTRILPVWNGSTFVEESTSNPLWAFWDIANNSIYGAGRQASKIDLQTVVDMAADADLRGDTFNYNFTATTPFPEAFDTALAVTRAKHNWSGDILSAVRDEWRAVPQMLLTDQQIIRGSINFNYVLNDEESSDAVIGEFLNEDTWNPAEIQYPPNSLSFTSVKPARIRLNGITNIDQMYREIAFYYKQAQLRRTKVSLETEHDGRLLKFGSVIKLQSFLPNKWGSSGSIVSKSSYTLTLDRIPSWSLSGQHYIEFRDKRGRYFGPIKISKVVGHEDQCLLDSADLAQVESDLGMTINDALDRMDGAEPPSFVIGLASEISRTCIVLGGKPSEDRVALELVVDSIDVHDEDLGTTPNLPTQPLLSDDSTPIVGSLLAYFRQGIAEPILDVSWWPVPGAQYYRAEVSYDNGISWVSVYEGVLASFSAVVDRASLKVRVSAHNTRHGPWSTTSVNAPEIVVAQGTVAPSSLISGLEDYVMENIGNALIQLDFLNQKIAALAADQDAANFIDKRSQRVILAEQNVSITETAEIATTIDGRLAAAWFVTLDNNGYVSGIGAYNDGSTSSFTVLADTFLVAAPSESGGAPIPVFEVAEVNGSAKMTLKGDFIADGAITARSISVNNLSAITANFGDSIYSGTIKSANEKMIIDFVNERIEIYD